MLAKIWNLIEKIIRVVLIKIAPVFGIKMNDEKCEAIIQFVKFGMVGASNTIVTYGIYYLGVGFGVNYQISNAVGYFAGIVNSFYWNNKYVFKAEDGENRSIFKAFIKCALSYLSGYVVSTLMLFVWVQLLGLSEFIAPIISLCITIPLNFVLNKKWAFKSES